MQFRYVSEITWINIFQFQKDQTQKDVEHKAQSKWEALNKAIKFVASEYKKKASKDKNFQYPAETIGNLVKFNFLRQQYTLDETKIWEHCFAPAVHDSILCSLVLP